MKDAKLINALMEFTEEMRLHFSVKERGGKNGWDDRGLVSDRELIDGIKSDLEGTPGPISYIDIANRAMMLWYRENYL